MFTVYEKLENNILCPIVNEYGTIPIFDTKEEANIERIYLQVECDNELVVK